MNSSEITRVVSTCVDPILVSSVISNKTNVIYSHTLLFNESVIWALFLRYRVVLVLSRFRE